MLGASMSNSRLGHLGEVNADATSAAQAQLIYSSHFSGLQSFGASGMTILDELTDLSLRVCENGRTAGQRHHARGAALLASNGKAYSGCDVYIGDGVDSNGVPAERAAFLAAIADGAPGFDCLVISSDTMKSFPIPDGKSREFLRRFGVFPVVLVNCDLEVR
jgi:cytidine deaminase